MLRGFQTDAVARFLVQNFPEVLAAPAGEDFILCRDGSAAPPSDCLRLDQLCDCYRLGDARPDLSRL